MQNYGFFDDVPSSSSKNGSVVAQTDDDDDDHTDIEITSTGHVITKNPLPVQPQQRRMFVSGKPRLRRPIRQFVDKFEPASLVDKSKDEEPVAEASAAVAVAEAPLRTETIDEIIQRVMMAKKQDEQSKPSPPQSPQPPQPQPVPPVIADPKPSMSFKHYVLVIVVVIALIILVSYLLYLVIAEPGVFDREGYQEQAEEYLAFHRRNGKEYHVSMMREDGQQEDEEESLVKLLLTNFLSMVGVKTMQ